VWGHSAALQASSPMSEEAGTGSLQPRIRGAQQKSWAGGAPGVQRAAQEGEGRRDFWSSCQLPLGATSVQASKGMTKSECRSQVGRGTPGRGHKGWL
jgi:hypothetical protein